MKANLSCSEVSLRLRDGGGHRSIIEGLTVTFEMGSLTTVGGPSGCGKTSLLSMLSLIERPSSGRILHGNACISDYSASEAETFRCRHVSLVFQTSRLIGTLTVYEHLSLVAHLRGVSDLNSGLWIIESLGLSDRLGSRPHELSGGQKQRVALAQALMCKTPIVLADEPTASVDMLNGKLVAETLRHYARTEQAVVVATTHDPALKRLANQNIELVPLGS